MASIGSCILNIWSPVSGIIWEIYRTLIEEVGFEGSQPGSNSCSLCVYLSSPPPSVCLSLSFLPDYQVSLPLLLLCLLWHEDPHSTEALVSSQLCFSGLAYHDNRKVTNIRCSSNSQRAPLNRCWDFNLSIRVKHWPSVLDTEISMELNDPSPVQPPPMALPPLVPVLLPVHTPLSAELNALLGLSPLLLIRSQPLLRAVTVVCGFEKQGKGTKYSVGGTAWGEGWTFIMRPCWWVRVA